KPCERVNDAIDDLAVGVADAHGSLMRALSVEDSSKETLVPVDIGFARPGNEIVDAMEARVRACTDRAHCLVVPVRNLKLELPRRDIQLCEVSLDANQGFEIDQRKSELVLRPGAPVRLRVLVASQQCIATDHPAQVAASIPLVVVGRRREAAG